MHLIYKSVYLIGPTQTVFTRTPYTRVQMVWLTGWPLAIWSELPTDKKETDSRCLHPFLTLTGLWFHVIHPGGAGNSRVATRRLCFRVIATQVREQLWDNLFPMVEEDGLLCQCLRKISKTSAGGKFWIPMCSFDCPLLKWYSTVNNYKTVKQDKSTNIEKTTNYDCNWLLCLHKSSF